MILEKSEIEENYIQYSYYVDDVEVEVMIKGGTVDEIRENLKNYLKIEILKNPEFKFSHKESLTDVLKKNETNKSRS